MKKRNHTSTKENHDPDDYVGCILHVTKGGSCVAVKPNGDIISLCCVDGDETRGWQLLKDAVKHYGVTIAVMTDTDRNPITICPDKSQRLLEGLKGE